MEINRNYLKPLGLLFCAASCCPVAGMAGEKVKRPNFVWFMAEDVSSRCLAIYNADGAGAKTPNVEKLAKEGIVFNHAFCNAPVSSAARSTLFTGFYAPRVGLSWHRKLEPVVLPEGSRMFPAYLTAAGYYTVNSSKTDYNCAMPIGTWNEAGGKKGAWRNRPGKDTPFFYVQTCAITHESSLQFNEEKMAKTKTRYNPSDVKVAPPHPDTELFRYTYATFYDRIEDSDAELGSLMQSLSEEGVMDDTFIFYFGDNGGALPGSKGYTGEQGLQVPLVVYIPKNWRDRVNIPAGSCSDGFVSFLDFGPALLHLAGIEVPQHMDGKPFLGEDISRDELEQRNITYGYGDRFDEMYAFNRTVRVGNYKYSRNFMPWQSKGFYCKYRYNMLAFQEWKNLHEGNKLSAVQKQFFEPQQPEELYDLAADPDETNNLAINPQYAAKLKELRGMLKEHLTDMNDLGLIPESEWIAEAAGNLVSYGKANHDKISRYSDIADLECLPFTEAKPLLKKALQSPDPIECYWAASVCLCFGKQAEGLKEEAKALLKHPSPIVKSRAATFLASIKQLEPAATMKEILLSARNSADCLLILGDMAYLKDYVCGPVFDIRKEDVKYPAGSYLWRVEYIQNVKHSSN